MSVSIGEFSRLSHLSAKTLRYYHQIDLLVPDDVDPGTGYRRYSAGQVGDAHLIRRLRDLDMPLAEIRQVLGEADGAARDSAIARHLDRMEAELTRTREVVASLRRLLGSPARVPVSHRQSPAVPALSVTARLRRDEVAAWCGATYPELYGTLARAGVEPAGAGGATYSTEFFEHDEGLISAFVPVPPSASPLPGFVVLAPQRYAVAVHSGRFTDCDLTYGYLGGHVAEHDVGLREPIRELYIVGPDHTEDPTRFQTEICWPIATVEAPRADHR